MHALDPLTLPLHGRRLLEASAGTGKTYTLALLFLRLLLERGLTVDQILVVTFTRAATSELRDRIRLRIREAIDHLEQRSEADPLLADLLSVSAMPPETASQRLTDALLRMDEAAIHTIHGFCQRILQEHAFESGTAFEVDLLENEDSLRQEVIEDFWRNRFYAVSKEEGAWAASNWTSPAGLLNSLGKAASTMDALVVPLVAAQELAGRAAESLQLSIELGTLWRQGREEVRAILENDPGLKRNANAYRLADQVPELLAAMDHLAEQAEPPFSLPKGINRLAASVMAGHLKKKGVLPEHPFFTLFDQWFHCQDHLSQHQNIAVVHEARLYLHAELDRRKQAQSKLAFDDLLTHLASALDRPQSGAQLAARIKERYPVAMVDEFQDTDPVQYHIFSRIYRQNSGSLFMIGDPKQAIYSFRGADIFTYIKARRATAAGNRSTLATNHRSTPAMVQAVNTLFSTRKDAFVFTGDIEFQPVKAGAENKAQPLVLTGQVLPPLTGFVLNTERLKNERSSTISKERAGRAAVDFCADTIAHLLAEAEQGRAMIGEKQLSTADIAILVRSHREAEAIREGLRCRGLSSISLSQSSVFASVEARNLALMLTALANLGETGTVRTALSTDLFAYTGEELHRFSVDEQSWEARLATLVRYRQIGYEQGILPLFQHLLTEEGLTRRLSGREGGHRTLTNYLHLVELLHQSPAAKNGMPALLRWLHRQINHPNAPDAQNGSTGDQLVRLEKDERLLRIITIHRAKGLEFPVVFLPFLWGGRALNTDQPFSFHDRQSLALTFDIGTGREDHRHWSEEEYLAEEVRLLYVAVTRAKSCCLFCWGRVNGLEHTGLAHLLHQGKCPADDTSLISELERLNTAEPLLRVQTHVQDHQGHQEHCQATDKQSFPTPDPLPKLQVARFQGRINPGWSMPSYSRLSAGSDGSTLLEKGDNSDKGDRDKLDSLGPIGPEDFTSIFTFPRGPVAGTCLHSLLEALDFGRPASSQQPLIAESLEQASIDPRWQVATAHWLDAIVAVPLPGACSLGQLATHDRINELSFLFPLQQVRLHRFNAIIAGAGLAPLSARPGALHGLMKGFVDLVFRHKGRYFIADYKSNYLGPKLVHYGPEALTKAMDSHHYPLQAIIYTLALHRFLGSRIKDYHYEEHFGGVYYMFLRAMHPEHPPGTGIHVSRQDYTCIQALDDCCRGGDSR